jgi:hypothetical protein
MRRYYIVSGIFLILHIIDFAVGAPVIIQEKHRAGVDVVHILGNAITMLGKRGSEFGELNELWPDLFRDPEDHFLRPEDFTKPKESPAARPSSSSPPSGPADGRMDFKPPLPSIPKETSPVSSPDDKSN